MREVTRSRLGRTQGGRILARKRSEIDLKRRRSTGFCTIGKARGKLQGAMVGESLVSTNTASRATVACLARVV